MSYALFVKVKIDPSRWEEARKQRKEVVVPRVTGSPGFVNALWFGNGIDNGHAVIVYETKEHAEQAASKVNFDPSDAAQQDGPTSVFEVYGSA